MDKKDMHDYGLDDHVDDYHGLDDHLGRIGNCMRVSDSINPQLYQLVCSDIR